MSIFEQSKKDLASIIQNSNDFGQQITIKTPTSSENLDLVGFHTKHHTAYDLDGAMVNSKNASIAISEKSLIDANYPYRNSNQEINMIAHLVDVVDSSGIVKNYIVREMFPDESLGLIVLILGDYEII